MKPENSKTLEFILTSLYHRPSNMVINDISCTDDDVRLLADGSPSKGPLVKIYPGCLGCGNDVPSLPSISTTDDIVGLSLGRSWTHKSPTLMHLNASATGHEQPIDSCTSSKLFPSFHKLHAYKF